MSRDDFAGGEFPILLLSSLYGVCLLSSADSFPTLFLGLELMSLPVYVLVLLAYRRPESAEAALKYLVLGGAATATFLMGASLLYGSSGSLAIDAFRARARRSDGAGARRRRPDRGPGVLPEGGDRAVPRLGAGRLRRRQRAGHGVHGDRRQGRRAARRGAAVRPGQLASPMVDAARRAAAGLDRLGQPRGDAPAELAPHDRVLARSRTRATSSTRCSATRPDASAGGRVLPARPTA